jgi:hypothetical protein
MRWQFAHSRRGIANCKLLIDSATTFLPFGDEQPYFAAQCFAKQQTEAKTDEALTCQSGGLD